MPADNLLVSCADEIHVWPFTSIAALSSTPSVTSRPHTGAITGLSLNHNNSVIVTCGIDGVIHLTNTNGTSLFTLPSLSSIAQSQSLFPLSCLSLTAGSRYVMTGGFGANSEITVWDLKRQSITRTLTGHTGEVTGISLGVPQSPTLMIASSDSDGQILIHNIDSPVPRLSFTHSSEAVRALQYNPHDSGMLVSVGDDGVPNVWDVASQSLNHTFHSSHYHRAPITSVQCSPLQSSLFATTSIDRTLVLHDLHSRLPVLIIECEAGAVSSSDWHDDGQTIVVGCLNGAILLYDIRVNGKCLTNIAKAHDSEVRSVRFSHVASKPAAAKSVGVRETPASVVSGSYQHTPATLGSNTSTGRPSLSHDEPVSAVKANGASDLGLGPVTPYIPHHRSATLESVTSTDTSATTGRAASDKGIPVDEASSPTSSTRRASRSSVVNIINRRSSFPAPAPFSATANSHPSSHSNSGRQSPASTSRSFTVSDTGDRRGSNRRSSTPLSAAKSGSNDSSGQSMPTVPSARSSLSYPTTTNVPNTVSNSESLQSSLDSRLGQWYELIHTDISNLHLDLFRQFHQQSLDTRALIGELRAENEELRREIRQLTGKR